MTPLDTIVRQLVLRLDGPLFDRVEGEVHENHGIVRLITGRHQHEIRVVGTQTVPDVLTSVLLVAQDHLSEVSREAETRHETFLLNVAEASWEGKF